MNLQNENFYTAKLHIALNQGEYKSESGVYLVSLRLLHKDSNIIIYNYVYYPDIFVNNILYFLIQKNNFSKSLIYREWGDFLSIIDNNLGDGCFIENIKINSNNSNIYFKDFLSNKPSYSDIKSYMDVMDVLKKASYIDIGSNMISLIDWAVKKNILSFLRL